MATKLEKRVARICKEYARSYERGMPAFMEDLQYGGCQSGLIGELIFHTDTLRFYRRYRDEIDTLLKETLSDFGMKAPAELFANWDDDDPLAHEQSNQNLLAWFGFEETATRLFEGGAR